MAQSEKNAERYLADSPQDEKEVNKEKTDFIVNMDVSDDDRREESISSPFMKKELKRCLFLIFVAASVTILITVLAIYMTRLNDTEAAENEQKIVKRDLSSRFLSRMNTDYAVRYEQIKAYRTINAG